MTIQHNSFFFPGAAAVCVLRNFGCIVLTGVLAVSTVHGQESAAVEQTRTVIQQWIETRRVIATESRDWKVRREFLESRIALLEREIEATRARTSEARERLTLAETEREQQSATAATDEALLAKLDALVGGLETRTRALLRRLPPAALDRLGLLQARLPAEGVDTRFGIGDRFLTVVGILNALNKFHPELTVTSEVREVADGTKIEVAVMHLGLGCAYYVSADGSVAGYGNPGVTSWVWSESNAAAVEIARAIAMHSGRQEAGFVRLPFNLQ